MKKVLIVESPAKSKTIGKYLGSEYTVIPSFGHIRDLPSKKNSVDPNKNFEMTWELSKTGSTFLKNLKTALKNADELLLATDPDREGEAISWHILESIKDSVNLDKIAVKRVVFHEITKKAIKQAIENPRDVDDNLVHAYLARRALDYLFGFTLSPLLWRRLPGCKSAGRVQSVALRILVDRENEIEKFKSEEFWTVDGMCQFKRSKFIAHLVKLNDKKISKMSIKDQAGAENAKDLILNNEFSITAVDKKTIKRSPPPPFITSTLQQEGARKLGFSSKKTMQLAQQLYEGVDIGGETKALITYMRTDSVNLSDDCITSVRKLINDMYGEKYLPSTPTKFKSKVKNAQEAHEAIRPVDVSILPESLTGKIDASLLKLYTLIWKRTVACQMSKADNYRTQLTLSSSDKKHDLRATGTMLVFDGFLKVYEEGTDNKNDDDEENQKIPEVSEGDVIKINDVKCDQHFTQPPARYTEASLVKKMEELGIGRPSTYATVIQVLQTRKYAVIKKKAFFPELNGRYVISFLKKYFPQYVEYDFTANMEEDLDDISNNEKIWDNVLSTFWANLSTNSQTVKDTTLLDVVNMLTEDLSDALFVEEEKGRKCPKCGAPLVLKLWSTSSYIGCSKYPDCDYRRKITGSADESEDDGTPLSDYPKNIGVDTATGAEIILKKGPYGPYLELQTEKKKRTAIPKGVNPLTLSLSDSEILLSLPKVLGEYEGSEISLGIGRFGPFLAHNKKFYSLKTFEALKNTTLESALERIKK